MLYNLLNRPTPGEEAEAISQVIGLTLPYYPKSSALRSSK